MKRFLRPRLLLPLLLAIPALCSAPAAFAKATEAVPDPRAAGLDAGERLEALLDRIRYEQAKVETLEARFTQLQENEFLAEPGESKGVFYYRSPDRVRWEYLSPNPITMVIDEGTLTTWYRDLNRVEKMKVGKYSDRILRYLGVSNSMDALLEYFDVRAAFPEDVSKPYRLELSPRFERIEKKLRSLTIWIDPELFVPQRLHYEGGGGGTTEYIFEDLVINQTLPPDRFELALPDGVEVRVMEIDRAP